MPLRSLSLRINAPPRGKACAAAEQRPKTPSSRGARFANWQLQASPSPRPSGLVLRVKLAPGREKGSPLSPLWGRKASSLSLRWSLSHLDLSAGACRLVRLLGFLRPFLGSAAAARRSAFSLPLQPASVTGSLSASSNASSKSRTRTRYRTKALNSEVDESLFGIKLQFSRSDSPIVVLRDAETVGRTFSELGWGRKPETIRLITKDLIRDLVVPAVDPSGESLIMSPEDFERMKDASRVLSKEEQEAELAALKAEKEADAAQRKVSMKQKELVRKKNEKLSDLEEEAKERAQYLLERANQMRLEQEEEIKEMSELMLQAKCHAIRDAQILEKQLIGKELDEEEKRLAGMMEAARQEASKIQEELERKRKEELIKGRRHIQRDQEAQEILEYLEQLQLEDEQDMEHRHQEQLKIQAEIKRINDENQKRKDEQLEQEKLADMRVMEYQKQKMAREAEFEAEQERIRREKELETARLRALQERAQDHQAEQVPYVLSPPPTGRPRLVPASSHPPSEAQTATQRNRQAAPEKPGVRLPVPAHPEHPPPTTAASLPVAAHTHTHTHTPRAQSLQTASSRLSWPPHSSAGWGRGGIRTQGQSHMAAPRHLDTAAFARIDCPGGGWRRSSNYLLFGHWPVTNSIQIETFDNIKGRKKRKSKMSLFKLNLKGNNYRHL
uniref:Cilia- and flagella-associated protein 45 n=1 Tax=Sphenodon punctatus TaxID=8508 RepID=A0A8D0GTB1_SPHPU